MGPDHARLVPSFGLSPGVMSTVLAPPRRSPPRHRRPQRARGFKVALAVLLVAALGVVAWRSGLADPVLDRFRKTASGPPAGNSSPKPSSKAAVMPSAPTPRAAQPNVTPGPINTAFPGLTTFRGNATRDYYGEGPLPKHPVVLWRYPRTGGMCMVSQSLGKSRNWCGTGWTGQPNVIPHKNGPIEIREGAYDGHYHFLNGMTGQPLRPDLVTGDLAKGSATSDSDGYPLYYGGSRDNYLRVIALDRASPTVLWQTNAHDVPHWVWNDDWDAAPLQIGDYLLEGGENSWFYVIRLNRHYDQKGLVQVQPKIVMLVPGWDQQLLNAIHDKDISIENSVAFYNGVVYFSNSGGLVQGWDISDILKGGTHYQRVFRFWDGDDTDASIVIDQQGYLYVSRKMEENVRRPSSFPRDHQIGSLMKLDPRKPDNPLVWSVQLGGFEPDGGLLGTPALYKGILYATFTEGGFAAVDARSGAKLWSVQLPGPTWTSPVPLDGQLLVGDCAGGLHAFDISHPRRGAPRELWRVQLEGCIESTPAVWHGMIWVGSRGGAIYGIGDRR
jgi:hypothetical protein